MRVSLAAVTGSATCRPFNDVDDVERTRGPLAALDRQIAFLYLDLGLSATQCAERLYVSSSVVLRRLADCGIARRPAGGSPPRLSHRTLQRTAYLYERLGLSLAAVARIEGIHPNAVRHRLRVAGVPLRSRGGRRHPAVQASFG
jgi:hypothetical protein